MSIRYLAAAPAALLALSLTGSAQSVIPATPAQLSALELAQATVQSIELPAERGVPFRAFVEINGTPAALELSPSSVRAPGYQLLVQGADGSIEPRVAPAPTTYTGSVAGFPGSRVSASLHGGGLHAMLVLQDGAPPWTVQPVERTQTSSAAHYVYPSDASLATGSLCATLNAGGSSLPQGTAAGVDLGIHKIIDLACDADVQFFQLNGSSLAAAQADVEAHISAVQTIYASSAKVLYNITAILVRTAEPDPYSSSNPFTLLNQLADHWNSSQGSIPRDTVHLFTGRSLDGSVIGVAQLDVICNLPNAYGLSQTTAAQFSNDVGLVAHELGHNWASNHCDGTPDCGVMCSALGGCTGNLSAFGNFAQTAIAGTKSSASCLTDLGPPTVTSASPTSLPSFLGGTLTLTGEDFWAVTDVRIGSQSLVFPQFAILDSTTIAIFNPVVESTGVTPIFVETETGTAAPVFVDFTPVTAPILSANPLAIPTLPYVWSFTGTPGDTYFLNFALSSATVPTSGFDILAFPNLINTGTLNAAGNGTFSIIAPVLGFINVYTQVLTFSGGGSFTGATNVVETLVF